MAGEFSDILILWYISFIDISSISLLFFISLYSDVIPREFGSGSNARRETTNFLGLKLRERRRQVCYFAFSFIIMACISSLKIGKNTG